MKREFLNIAQALVGNSVDTIGHCLNSFLNNYQAGHPAYLAYVNGETDFSKWLKNGEDRKALMDSAYKSMELRFSLVCTYYEMSLREQFKSIGSGSRPKLNRSWMQIANEIDAVSYSAVQKLERRILKLFKNDSHFFEDRWIPFLKEKKDSPYSVRIFAVAFKDCLEHSLIHEDQVNLAFNAMQLDFALSIHRQLLKISASDTRIPFPHE